MSPLAVKIAERIAAGGPIRFSEFMRMALYDEEHGYYRGDPFGKRGDFFTAAQLQPVFGAYARALAGALMPGFHTFIDIGAGREEMRLTFADMDYRAVQYGQAIPKTNEAVLFANEFIDALPVDVSSQGRLMRVACADGKFFWHDAPPSAPVLETRETRPHLEEAWRAVERGVFILIDYGYRERERVRFEAGSLMSYRRHVALEDVLAMPGEQDITAHVDWDALMGEAVEAGWKIASFGSLRSSLLALGPDTLEALYSLDQMQFRTLFHGMGESFEVLVLQKV